jgi:hypothetical protein
MTVFDAAAAARRVRVGKKDLAMLVDVLDRLCAVPSDDLPARCACLLRRMTALLRADGGAVYDETGGPDRGGLRERAHYRWSHADKVGWPGGRARHGGTWQPAAVTRASALLRTTTTTTGGPAHYLHYRHTPPPPAGGAGTSPWYLVFRRRGDAPPFGPKEDLLLRAVGQSRAVRFLDRPHPGRRRTTADALPWRALQVLSGLKTGRSEKEIALDLGVSWHTVHAYVKVIYRSYGVSSRGELLGLWLAGGPYPGNPVPSGARTT